MSEQGYEYAGCKFETLAITPKCVTVTVCFGSKRYTVKGPLSVVRTRGSYRYGDELHFTVHSSDVPTEDLRAFNNGWTRIEVAVELKPGLQLLKDALDCLDRDLAKFM